MPFSIPFCLVGENDQPAQRFPIGCARERDTNRSIAMCRLRQFGMRRRSKPHLELKLMTDPRSMEIRVTSGISPFVLFTKRIHTKYDARTGCDAICVAPISDWTDNPILSVSLGYADRDFDHNSITPGTRFSLLDRVSRAGLDIKIYCGKTGRKNALGCGGIGII